MNFLFVLQTLFLPSLIFLRTSYGSNDFVVKNIAELHTLINQHIIDEDMSDSEAKSVIIFLNEILQKDQEYEPDHLFRKKLLHEELVGILFHLRRELEIQADREEEEEFLARPLQNTVALSLSHVLGEGIFLDNEIFKELALEIKKTLFDSLIHVPDPIGGTHPIALALLKNSKPIQQKIPSHIYDSNMMLSPEDLYQAGLVCTYSGDYVQALRHTHKSAQKGFAAAQNHAGYLWLNHFIHQAQASERALNWFHQSAEQDYPIASFNIGWMYFNGRGVTRNYETALTHFRTAASKGNILARYMCAVLLSEKVTPSLNTQHQEEISHLLNLLKAHDAILGLHLWGCFSLQGIFLAQNYENAFDAFTTLANMGVEYAQHNLGLLYLWGAGTPQDEKRALFWLSEAATWHHAAQRFAQAGWHLLRIQFDPEPFTNRLLELAFTPKQHLHAALECYLPFSMLGYEQNKVDQDNYPSSQHMLGIINILVLRDVPNGISWLEHAASQNYIPSLFYLSKLYATGRHGIKKDMSRALFWCKKAAGLGVVEAQNSLQALMALESKRNNAIVPQKIVKKNPIFVDLFSKRNQKSGTQIKSATHKIDASEVF